jgi:hypothetical protein
MDFFLLYSNTMRHQREGWKRKIIFLFLSINTRIQYVNFYFDFKSEA